MRMLWWWIPFPWEEELSLLLLLLAHHQFNSFGRGENFVGRKSITNIIKIGYNQIKNGEIEMEIVIVILHHHPPTKRGSQKHKKSLSAQMRGAFPITCDNSVVGWLMYTSSLYVCLPRFQLPYLFVYLFVNLFVSMFFYIYIYLYRK